MSNPFNPFPNPFGTHAHIQQGGPVPGPVPSMQGTPQEEIRNQIMARVGQYGPTPKHRVRGAIGGQNVELTQNQWVTLLRDDIWHEDATGAFNANFKTLVLLAPPQSLRNGAGSGGNAVGTMARVRFGVGGTTSSQLIVDVPANGMVHIPFCAETVIAETAVEVKIVSTAYMNAGSWVPDDPFLDIPNAANSGFPATHPPVMSGAVVPGQGLATNPVNMPTRQIGVILAGDGTVANVPIPRGTQAVQVFGPGDLAAVMVTNTLNTPLHIALTPGEITPLFSNTSLISASSAADGGLAAFYFYLGI